MTYDHETETDWQSHSVCGTRLKYLNDTTFWLSKLSKERE